MGKEYIQNGLIKRLYRLLKEKAAVRQPLFETKNNFIVISREQNKQKNK